jgi:hypothetical protein
VQRRALGALFTGLAVALVAIAVWMGDLARRVWP